MSTLTGARGVADVAVARVASGRPPLRAGAETVEGGGVDGLDAGVADAEAA
jgi:hypothetical protein